MPVIRILLVEDDKPVANMIRRSLGALGYLVMGATDSGDVAVHEAQDGKPDLVLMDIELNGSIDGIEAARKIYCSFEIPVVFITASQDEQIFFRAKAAEPFGYLVKPFKDHQLRNAIEIALHQHKASRERANKVQHEADAHYRAIMRETLVGIFQAKLSGEFLHVNQALLQILGYDSYDELLAKAKSLNRTLRFEPGQAPGLDGNLGNTNHPDSFELQAYKSDGTTIWVSGSARVIRDTAGRALYFEGNLLDITEQRRVDSENPRTP